LSGTTRAWLFVRGPESVRIVLDGVAVGVYGPGALVSRRTFGEEMDATLHQADVEQALVRDGWTLEQLTTERRSADREASTTARPERTSTLRIVPDPEDPSA
jgi:hypothetical protein